MESLFKAGADVYDQNTGQTGVLLTGPYEYKGPRGGQVTDVQWDNGEEMTVYISHLHTFKRDRG